MIYETPTINTATRFHCAADWSWDVPPGRLKDYDLWCVHQGSGNLCYDGRNYNLAPGTCFILHPEKEIVGRHDPQNPLVVTAVHFDPMDVGWKGLPEFLIIRDIHVFKILCDRLIESVIKYGRNSREAGVRFLNVLLELREQSMKSAQGESGCSFSGLTMA